MKLCRVVAYLPEIAVTRIDSEARKKGGISRSEVLRRWIEPYVDELS